jgi:alpha-D-ribose 1-methylphosphonate 5-triphosphate synthase subunit PhnH
MPTRSDFEAQTHATFDCLMWALAYPGRVSQLVLPATLSPFAAIAYALLDLETSAYSDDPALQKVLSAIGAKQKPSEQAHYLFFQQLPTPEVLRGIRRGTPLMPETAAMLVLATRFGVGQKVRCTGAGVQSSQEFMVDLPPEFFAVREEVIAFPIGWDVLLLDGANVIGLPRTTRIEVI